VPWTGAAGECPISADRFFEDLLGLHSEATCGAANANANLVIDDLNRSHLRHGGGGKPA
jgi:hypothetical protein